MYFVWCVFLYNILIAFRCVFVSFAWFFFLNFIYLLGIFVPQQTKRETKKERRNEWVKQRELNRLSGDRQQKFMLKSDKKAS